MSYLIRLKQMHAQKLSFATSLLLNLEISIAQRANEYSHRIIALYHYRLCRVKPNCSAERERGKLLVKGTFKSHPTQSA